MAILLMEVHPWDLARLLQILYAKCPNINDEVKSPKQVAASSREKTPCKANRLPL